MAISILFYFIGKLGIYLLAVDNTRGYLLSISQGYCCEKILVSPTAAL